MSANWQKDVRDFHEKCGLELHDSPSLPSEDTINLRIALIQEEVDKELLHCLGELIERRSSDKNPFVDDLIVGIADGMVDAMYVILGTAVSFGIDLQPIWDATQKANMQKYKGPRREDGKILKPEGWKHPDVQALIEEQIPGESRIYRGVDLDPNRVKEEMDRLRRADQDR